MALRLPKVVSLLVLPASLCFLGLQIAILTRVRLVPTTTFQNLSASMENVNFKAAPRPEMVDEDIRSLLKPAELSNFEADLERVLEEILVEEEEIEDSKRVSYNGLPMEKVAQQMTPATYNNKVVNEILEYDYLMTEKLPPYVGSTKYIREFPLKNQKIPERKYLNSLAVFPGSDDEHMHGVTGIYPDGFRWWTPKKDVPAIGDHPDGPKECLKRGGGFYLDLSDGLPLDRPVPDHRKDVCRAAYDDNFDISHLDDASVIFTVFNEPLSTLLRSVTSVLNYTPPALLREIIIVDDHSDHGENRPGGPLEEAVKLLPKTKILRLPDRRGLVMARLAGAQAASAPVTVVLDSHIEVNKFWLEPLLQRLHESPTSVVFPIIYGINPETFEASNHSGIGVFVTWFWNMIENSSMRNPDQVEAVPSPGMAGGLFAVKSDWFWKFGGYDEQFAMWGTENVEMPFRVWMCGGRVEGIPCSLTYHIYRKGGVGYSSPGEAVLGNKLRTAKLWMGKYYQLAKIFIMGGHRVPEERLFGDFDKMLELKSQLGCKNFDWFLREVDPNHDVQLLENIIFLGEMRNYKHSRQCVDNMGSFEKGGTFDRYGCHGLGGSQAFYMSKERARIVEIGNERLALEKCSDSDNVCSEHATVLRNAWDFQEVPNLPLPPQVKPDTEYRVGTIHVKGSGVDHCLTMVGTTSETSKSVRLEKCVEKNLEQVWLLEQWKPDPNYQEPTMSPAYRERNVVV